MSEIKSYINIAKCKLQTVLTGNRQATLNPISEVFFTVYPRPHNCQFFRGVGDAANRKRMGRFCSEQNKRSAVCGRTLEDGVYSDARCRPQILHCTHLPLPYPRLDVNGQSSKHTARNLNLRPTDMLQRQHIWWKNFCSDVLGYLPLETNLVVNKYRLYKEFSGNNFTYYKIRRLIKSP